MADVHPTAIVDSRAELADDVSVGPGCIIEGTVRIGRGTRLLHRVSLQGPMTLGEANVLYPNVCLGFAPQDLKFDPDRAGAGLVIGSRNTFREGVTIHRATGEQPTRVGDDNVFMVNAHAGHDVQVGNACMIVNGALLAGHCEVGDRAIVSGNAAVHQFCRVGRLAMLGGTFCVTQDLPPFCTSNGSRSVGGINRVGLRRAGLGDHATAVKQAFDLIYRRRHLPGVAADLIESELGEDPLCMELVEFLRTTRRGITPFRSNNRQAAVG